MITSMCVVPEQAKLICSDRNQAIGCLGRGWGKVTVNRQRRTFWGAGNVLYLDPESGYMTI